MGKAQVSFSILVPASALVSTNCQGELERLRGLGHTIIPAPVADMYLDEATLAKRTYVEAALKGARARRKGKAKDEAVS